MINTYSFYFSSGEDEDPIANFPLTKNVEHSVTIDSEEPWTVPMREFCSFLSSVYGYNISDKIIVETLMDDIHFRTVDPRDTSDFNKAWPFPVDEQADD